MTHTEEQEAGDDSISHDQPSPAPRFVGVERRRFLDQDLLFPLAHPRRTAPFPLAAFVFPLAVAALDFARFLGRFGLAVLERFLGGRRLFLVDSGSAFQSRGIGWADCAVGFGSSGSSASAPSSF